MKTGGTSSRWTGVELTLDSDEFEYFRLIRDGIVGNNHLLSGPYGFRKIVYCDWTASGRALSFLENYLANEILPFYSNVHTNSSPLSYQTFHLREEARNIIARTVNACDKKDCVIFTGSGSTGAINHLLASLRLNSSCNSHLARAKDDSKNPVVFLSFKEHHSNLLPWRESICTIVTIPDDPSTGCIDKSELLVQLNKFSDRPLKIGCFSAISNVTGIIERDIVGICRILHENGALAFWDFATAGPYVGIDMNPITDDEDDRGLSHIDALFLSPHKFPGGICTPGILVAKKYLFSADLSPARPGGGVVDFVSSSDHFYAKNIHYREESGTPDIVGSIRAGLVFQLKHSIKCQVIMERELAIVDRAYSLWNNNPRIHILGQLNVPRLTIFSFVIYHPSGRFLHYNFVCTLLSDLFGIQARGGCVCSGPYSHQLLGIDLELAKKYEEQLLQFKDSEILRPGFTRLNIPYFSDESQIDYIIKAVDFVASEGWKLLPQYIFYPESNEWKHRNNKVLFNRKWLGEISYESGKMEYPENKNFMEQIDLEGQISYLDEARRIVDAIDAPHYAGEYDREYKVLREEAERIRWFVYPEETYLERIPIDGDRSNYKCREWVSRWRQFCPFIPEYYDAIRSDGIVEKSTLVAVFGGVCGEETICNEKSKVTNFPFFIPKSSFLSRGRSQLDLKLESMIEEDEVSESVIVCCDGEGEEDECPIDNIDNDYTLEKLIVECPMALCGGDCTSVPSVLNEKGDERRGDSSFFDGIGGDVNLLERLERRIFKSMIHAVREFDLISPGDRILVGVSGGKDSLSLLYFLMKMRDVFPFKFEIGAITVDPLTMEYDPSPLKIYMKKLGIPYFYISQPLISIAKRIRPSSICSWCSRMKRGILHSICIKEGYNVLALGHHLDDLAESFLMYAFHNGKLDTIKSATFVRDKSLKVIRPFVFIRERETKKFALLKNLPIISENCPACFEEPKERARIKALLKSQERLYDGLFGSLMSALKPLMHPKLHLDQILVNLKKNIDPDQLKKYYPKNHHLPSNNSHARKIRIEKMQENSIVI